jgi:hypothetical protein
VKAVPGLSAGLSGSGLVPAPADDPQDALVPAHDPQEPIDHERSALRARRRSWARLLRRIYEVDPLLCPRCCVEMRVVAVIQGQAVVDRILRHRERTGCDDPFEQAAIGRAPPEA